LAKARRFLAQMRPFTSTRRGNAVYIVANQIQGLPHGVVELLLGRQRVSPQYRLATRNSAWGPNWTYVPDFTPPAAASSNMEVCRAGRVVVLSFSVHAGAHVPQSPRYYRVSRTFKALGLPTWVGARRARPRTNLVRGQRSRLAGGIPNRRRVVAERCRVRTWRALTLRSLPTCLPRGRTRLFVRDEARPGRSPAPGHVANAELAVAGHRCDRPRTRGRFFTVRGGQRPALLEDRSPRTAAPPDCLVPAVHRHKRAACERCF